MSKGLNRQEARQQIKMQAEAMAERIVLGMMKKLRKEVKEEIADLSGVVLARTKAIERDMKLNVNREVKGALRKLRRAPILTREELEILLNDGGEIIGI